MSASRFYGSSVGDGIQGEETLDGGESRVGRRRVLGCFWGWRMWGSLGRGRLLFRCHRRWGRRLLRWRLEIGDIVSLFGQYRDRLAHWNAFRAIWQLGSMSPGRSNFFWGDTPIFFQGSRPRWLLHQ